MLRRVQLAALVLSACAAAPLPRITAVFADGTVTLEEDGLPVLVYQVAPQDRDGQFRRAGYVHPLYDLDGNVLTEDFPADHRHQRGVYWAWHQVRVDGRKLGDPWEAREFVENVDDAMFGGGTLHADLTWSSPTLVDADGAPVPVVSERTRITPHPRDGDRRCIDFAITLRALVPGVTLGGSEDVKGYGGFSARVVLPDGVRFLGRDGEVEPQNTAVGAGPWIDLWGLPGGLAILQHTADPGFPEPWILRRKASMQNPAWPGRAPVALSEDSPVTLRYRVVVHRREVDVATLERWFEEYQRQEQPRVALPTRRTPPDRR